MECCQKLFNDNKYLVLAGVECGPYFDYRGSFLEVRVTDTDHRLREPRLQQAAQVICTVVETSLPYNNINITINRIKLIFVYRVDPSTLTMYLQELVLIKMVRPW